MKTRESESAGRVVLTFVLAILVVSACSQCKLSAPFSPLEPNSSSSPADVELTAPILVSPESGAALDNGRTDNRDKIVWDFSWKPVKGASSYQIYVIHSGSSIPVIDCPYVKETSYHYESTGYIIDANRFGWIWKVQAVSISYAFGAGDKHGPWSEERRFDVEPVNTDPPSTR